MRVLVVGVGRAAALSIAALSARRDAALVAAVDPASAARAILPPDVPFFPSISRLPAALDADVAVASTTYGRDVTCLLHTLLADAAQGVRTG